MHSAQKLSTSEHRSLQQALPGRGECARTWKAPQSRQHADMAPTTSLGLQRSKGVGVRPKPQDGFGAATRAPSQHAGIEPNPHT